MTNERRTDVVVGGRAVAPVESTVRISHNGAIDYRRRRHACCYVIHRTTQQQQQQLMAPILQEWKMRDQLGGT